MVFALMFGIAGPASAVPSSEPRAAERGPNTDLVMSGTGPGQAVQGFIANPGSSFNPVADGYPASNPTTGFTPLNEGFAGIIHGTLVGGGTLDMYCIDIRTATYGGIGYEEGSWAESNVPNVGYVARILNRYFPEDPTRPAGLTSDNQRAAAVQAAIWFFTDKYVLSTSDPLRGTVEAITTAVIQAGPLPEPPPPTLNISPFTDSAPAGQTAGPFIVNSGVVSPTVTATGATMYSDPAGTLPIANGSTVPNGQQIWLKSDTAGPATLSATATATYPTGNVYLYDRNTAGVNDAQRLIIAEQSTLTTTVKAVATFQAPGSLVVNKNISGPAAGSQGEVRIAVNCGAAAPDLPDFVIPAGAAAAQQRAYPGIPAGSVCTVTETVDGHTATVLVTVTGNGQQVTVPSGGSIVVTLSDTYTFAPGSLVVSKTITGVAAGDQGEVSISVSCPGTSFDPFVIPAGQAEGTLTREFGPIPADTECTVTETANGNNAVVDVIV
ncbi:MAG TPA: thioester domain-containing protein, partial [Microlunatus sp.]|nr:thioester domain-containing protein [Microlunatus sp.]